jgi:VWFA-related protein
MDNRNMTAIASLLAALLCCTAPVQAAQKTAVFVTASFLDRNRLYVENLKRDEVLVFEDGQPREVEFFAGEEVPVAYGLLLDRVLLPEPFAESRPYPDDISSSTAALNVAYKLLDECLRGQAGWAATYDAEMHVVVDFTQDGGRVKQSIQQLRSRRSQDESSLYSAVVAAVQKMDQRNEKRRVLVAFLDVLDRNTGGKLKLLKNLLSASNVELFIAGFASKSGSGRGMLPLQSESSLRDLAAVTAGDAFFSAMDGIEGLGRRLSNQIRTFYTIGFESESSPDKPVRLTIECTRPGVKVKTHPVTPTLR